MTEFDDPGVTDDERTSGYELTEREIDALSQATTRSIEWFHTLTQAERREAVRTIVDEFQERYNESARVGVDKGDFFVRVARQEDPSSTATWDADSDVEVVEFDDTAEEDAGAIEDPNPRWREFSSSAVEDVTPDWPTKKDSEDE